MKTSLVVIGKNDLSTLQAIYTDAYLDQLRSIYSDLIYVDSCSNDESPAYMLAAGFSVYKIIKGEMCSPAAGRWIGTRVASGHLIQFLDSDMELRDPLRFHCSMIDVLQRSDLVRCKCVGVVPQVDDYYPDGKVRTRIRRRGTGQRATSFGGCLLIDRDALVAIGGWRYSLDSSEDLDLMARLSCNGLGVAYNEDTYVIHHTRKASILDELGDYYLPTRPRFGSIGRALVAQDGFAAVLSILKIHREALLFPAALLIFLLHPCLGLFALAGAEFDLLRRRSVKYNVVIPGAFLSIFFGVFQSDRRKDEPRYAMVG